MAAVLCLAPNFAAAGAPEVKPAQDFQGIGYSVTSSGKVAVFAGARDIGGKLAVCGLVYFEKPSATTRAAEPLFTEHIRFSIAGKGLSVNSHAFKRYKTEAEAFAGNAGCAVTTTPWVESYGKTKLSLKMGRGSIRF